MSILNITGINLPVVLITILSAFSSKTNIKEKTSNSDKNIDSNKTKLSETTKKNDSNKTKLSEATKKNDSNKTKFSETTPKNDSNKTGPSKANEKNNSDNNNSIGAKAGDDMKSINRKSTTQSAINAKKNNISRNTKPTKVTKNSSDNMPLDDIYKMDLSKELIDECNKLDINEVGKLLISSSSLLQNNLAIYLKSEANKIEKLLNYLDENETKTISVEEMLQFKTSVANSMNRLEEIEAQLNKQIKTGIELIKHSHKYDFNSSSDDD